MRRVLLLVSTTALVVLVACGVALAASINCPTGPGGVCNGTNQGDALYGTPNVDRMYGYGTGDLMNGYGAGDFMYGGDERGLGDKMRGGTGADLVNGQRGNDLIEGGPGRDTLKTGRGSDRVEAKDGFKDTITCRGSNDAVYYDRGLDVLEGCPNALTTLATTGSPFEPGTKALVDHEGERICLPEGALNGHLEHGDKVLSWSGCSEQQ
jgi:RTX calcium-binding nonapeptide repeat (4 copies)